VYFACHAEAREGGVFRGQILFCGRWRAELRDGIVLKKPREGAAWRMSSFLTAKKKSKK
jgi:hypothetical protein